MEEPGSFKKTKRKIRCTQEFNQLHRKSLAITPSKGSYSEKKVSKKNDAFSYLPKIDLDFGSKENCSPNISEKKLSERKNKNEPSKDENICNSDIKKRCNKTNTATFTDGERKDSTEVLFKKRRKKKKQPHFEEESKTCSYEDLSKNKTEGNSIILSTTTKLSPRQNYIEQNFDTNEVACCTKDTRPRSIIKNLNVHSARKSILKTTSKSLSDLALTPRSSEELSDNVFTDSFKLSETLECNDRLTSGNRSKESNTFELQDSIFDISQLPVIPSSEKDLSRSQNNGNRRSRSLNNEKNITKNFINTNSKSVNSIRKEDCMRSRSLRGNSSKMNNSSLCNASFISRKSVRFIECKNDDKHSPIYETNNSNQYRKSPYIRKLRSTSSENQIFSPQNKRNNLSQNRQNLFKTSPNGTSTSFNETFEIVSPTKSESKITKRKQWNQRDVSILDSSGLLHTISPPWDIKETDQSFDFSFGRNSSLEINLLDLNCQRIRTSQKKTSNHSTPTQKISNTERLDHTSSANKNSTRKKSALILNSAKQSKSTNTHVETLKWAESPIRKYSCSNKKNKMPNFALIHQKAYDKLENVKDMTERKALRTKLLLSGKKPDIENLEVIESPNFKIKSPKSKKMIRFIPKRKSLDKLNQPQASLSLKTSTRVEVVPSTSNPKVITNKSLNKKSNIPKLTKKTLEDQKKGITKLSLKSCAEEKKKKQDQIKAIANKTKVVRNSIETRRNAVQNVRSNRRFELLMKMRKGKNS